MKQGVGSQLFVENGQRNKDVADRSERIRYYTQWLISQAQNPQVQNDERVYRDLYAQSALQELEARGRKFTLFAPYRGLYSAFHSLTWGQITVLCLLLCSVILAICFYGMTAWTWIVGVIVVFYFSDLLSFF